MLSLFNLACWRASLSFALVSRLSRQSHAGAKSGLAQRSPRSSVAMRSGYLFVEVSLFSFIALLIAQLGTLVVASHQAVPNFPA